MAPQSFEDLQSRNLSYLRDQKYKTAMPFIAAGLNSLQRKGEGELKPCDPYYAIRPYLEKIGLSRKQLDKSRHFVTRLHQTTALSGKTAKT
ncbi:hypothetical protein N7453_007698 [Penicillium expansum]|nr:hypothetical protein N7453_007698 [Penicillium expansum]